VLGQSVNQSGQGKAVADNIIENPFGVMDVPSPYDADVIGFAGKTSLYGAPDDANAEAWASTRERGPYPAIEGRWESRWNGAADPTIPGDSAATWKRGVGEVRIVGDRVYLKFDWNNGVRERPDRSETRRRKSSGREIHQPEQSRNHATVDRLHCRQ
jgi:hypothetical protein